MDHEMRDKCGVFGFFDTAGERTDAARQAYYGLFALQHRGQEGAGICVNHGGRLFAHREQGLVVEVFDEVTLNLLKGASAIGHVNLATQSRVGDSSLMPLLLKSRNGQIALSNNGAITNADRIRVKLEENGATFSSDSDSEVVLSLIARNRILTERMEDALFMTMAEITGSYALTILTPDALYGVRDPLGIRPLCLGMVADSYVLASESCALDAIGASFLRDVDPGEIITISKDGLRSEFMQEVFRKDARSHGRICLFEYIYFSRPDSLVDGASIYEARREAGRILAREAPADVDVVIGAPDSGITAAIGFADEPRLPYQQGILKNRYVGRTFIQPTQIQRELAVSMKFSPLRGPIAGKRIVLVDDSVVRGTTTRHVISMLKRAGVKEVHLRIAAPPVAYPCFYGVDMPNQDELSAANMSKDELQQMIGADSLEYISLEGLTASIRGLTCGTCTACFDGRFIAGVPDTAKEHLHPVDLLSQGYRKSSYDPVPGGAET